jgi:hypothetical protein
MRSLLFTIWLQADKSVTTTLSLLEQLTLAQLETINQGGSRLINASLSGKSFSYQLPDNFGMFQFEEMIRLAYKRISLGGASGGQMTDAELQTYVLDANDEVTDTIIARVSYNNNRA